MWQAVDLDLFMKRWILLMKSGEVKTQKKNYLVFLIFTRNRLLAGSFRRNPAGSPCLKPSSCPLNTLQIFHGLTEIGVFLFTLTVSFSPLTYTG